ncbi:hypothetical protein HRbin28_02643 [bacterium HR28]|nr:hypothetical protein HRbin28_02643 [bacterium HR28]
MVCVVAGGSARTPADGMLWPEMLASSLTVGARMGEHCHRGRELGLLLAGLRGPKTGQER